MWIANLAEESRFEVGRLLKASTKPTAVDSDAERNRVAPNAIQSPKRFLITPLLPLSVKSKLTVKQQQPKAWISRYPLANGCGKRCGNCPQSERGEGTARAPWPPTTPMACVDCRTNITVSGESHYAAKAQKPAPTDAGDAITDAMITSKVKSSFLLKSPQTWMGLDIKV